MLLSSMSSEACLAYSGGLTKQVFSSPSFNFAHVLVIRWHVFGKGFIGPARLSLPYVFFQAL